MAPFQTITADELHEKLQTDSGFVLIDTLGERSYNRAHLPGAVSIDAHADDFVDQVKEKVPDTDQQIIVYCASFQCQLSPQAAEKLTEAGYSNVFDFEGGLKDWAQQGYDLEGEDAEEVKSSLAE